MSKKEANTLPHPWNTYEPYILIDGFKYTVIGSGAYGVIFASEERGVARKVFWKNRKEIHAEAVFKSETNAYALAMNCEELKKHVPQFIGECSGQFPVYDKDDKDISGEFYTDLSYDIEKIRPKDNTQFHKLEDNQDETAIKVKKPFEKAQILHTKDTECIIDTNGAYKCVDFATREIEPEAD